MLFKYEGACRFFRYLTLPVNDSPQAYGDSAISNGSLAWPLLMCAGGFAGVASWFSTFPFDVIKTRVQSIDHPRAIQDVVHESSDGLLKGSKLGREPHVALRRDFYSGYSEAAVAKFPGASRIRHPYQTTWSTIVHSYRTEGFQVFFHGLSPTLIRYFSDQFVSCPLALLIYEYSPLRRAIPVNMVTFGVFEACVRLMS